MDKLIHKINVGQWLYFTKTEDHSGLKKYGVNKSNIDRLAEIIRKEIDGDENEDSLEDQKHLLDSTYKISELITYYQCLNNMLPHKQIIDNWLILIGKPSTISKSLVESIEKIAAQLNESYQISVEDVEDLQILQKEIDRRIQVYKGNEILMAKTGSEGATFQDLVIAVFRIMGYDKVDYDMIMSDFIVLKEQASKTIKTTKK